MCNKTRCLLKKKKKTVRLIESFIIMDRLNKYNLHRWRERDDEEEEEEEEGTRVIIFFSSLWKLLIAPQSSLKHCR